IIACWPDELQAHVRFYPVDSMGFFAAQAVQRQDRPGLVFVDGNHDFEFAQFDILSSARLIEPGGFIFVDNISQPGPFWAALDFLKSSANWREIGGSAGPYRPQFPYDRARTAIVNTDFCVLRAPTLFAVGPRPVTTGEQWWQESEVKGLLAHV